MTQKTFIPNSFQTPNVYVDKLMGLLTPEEFVVLIYAIRRILGFQKRQDRISLSQFAKGTQASDGMYYDSGTGLSVPTIRRCLGNLVRYGLMRRVDENNTDNEGTLWELSWDENSIDWAGLLARKAEREQADKAKMEAARAIRDGIGGCNAITGGVCNAITGGVCNGITTQYTEDNQLINIKGDAPAKNGNPESVAIGIINAGRRGKVKAWPPDIQELGETWERLITDSGRREMLPSEYKQAIKELREMKSSLTPQLLESAYHAATFFDGMSVTHPRACWYAAQEILTGKRDATGARRKGKAPIAAAIKAKPPQANVE